MRKAEYQYNITKTTQDISLQGAQISAPSDLSSAWLTMVGIINSLEMMLRVHWDPPGGTN